MVGSLPAALCKRRATSSSGGCLTRRRRPSPEQQWAARMGKMVKMVKRGHSTQVILLQVIVSKIARRAALESPDRHECRGPPVVVAARQRPATLEFSGGTAKRPSLTPG